MIRSDYHARTSNVNDKKRHKIVEFVHVGVKLVYDHGRKGDQDAVQWLPIPTMTMGRSVSEKSDKTTWRSRWMSGCEKFSEKSLWALSSQNQTWDGVELAEGREEDAPKQNGF